LDLEQQSSERVSAADHASHLAAYEPALDKLEYRLKARGNQHRNRVKQPRNFSHDYTSIIYQTSQFINIREALPGITRLGNSRTLGWQPLHASNAFQMKGIRRPPIPTASFCNPSLSNNAQAGRKNGQWSRFSS
jgi:hypothetical protein